MFGFYTSAMFKGERFNSISHLVGAALPPAGFVWLLAGGLFYTSGIVFYALDRRYPWMHGM